MKKILLIIFAAGLLLHCDNADVVVALYSPPVVFVGNVNNKYDSLPGNVFWPNRCMLVGDTVRMYFYSEDFGESNRIRHGDLVRVDFYPGHDTLIGKSHILFHMARYWDRNESYTVHPTHQLSEKGRTGARAVRFERFSGGEVHLENFFATTGPVPGTYGEKLEITQGRIKGRVE